MPLRSRLTRYPAYVFHTVLWLLNRVYKVVLRPKPAGIDKMRLDLNDPTLLPQETKRLYIYSKTDSIIRWQDVERHIEDARKAGIEVTVEKYEESPHVTHARMDGNRCVKL